MLPEPVASASANISSSCSDDTNTPVNNMSKHEERRSGGEEGRRWAKRSEIIQANLACISKNLAVEENNGDDHCVASEDDGG